MKRQLTQSVTFKSVSVAAILIPINCYWVIEMEVIRYSGHPVTISLFFNVIFSLFLLIGANRVLIRFCPAVALNQGELVIVYLMLSIASGITGHDMLEILVPMLGHAFRFATPENEWHELFLSDLPRWLTVSDSAVLQGYYEGESSLYVRNQLLGWMSPVLWWTTFLCVLIFGMLCINVLIRKRWIEQEKLSYPIIQLPLQMTATGHGGFFRNKIMWLGFGIAGGLAILNGFHFIFPIVPELRTRIRSFRIFTEKPWDAMGNIPISLYPFAIGLGFFIPLDLSFSCWFFFWFWRLMRVGGAAMGLQSLPRFPYMGEQASGGYIALCVIALWASRHHLIQVTRKAFSGATELDDTGEPMRYRTAVFGLIGVMAFLVLFCYYGGASIRMASAFFALYYAISIAITRMRAELGTPVHDLHYSGPDEILTRAFGTRRLGKGNLVMFSMFWFINRAYRSHPMPHQLEGFKIAERTQMNPRRIAFALMLAALLGSLAGFWALVDRGYRLGMETRAYRPSLSAFGIEPYRRLDRWLSSPTDTLAAETGFMGLGFLLTSVLMFFRMRFVWWPFHPAGFAISTSWGMRVTWSCLFMSWLIKWTLLRFGGIRLHRSAAPFFLGLILGEFTVGSLWTIIGIIVGIPTYGFWV
ncbi:MAG: hypothetical protein O7E52_05095 [Candidatus Poribacteria bacterium]|nr:hypothetical protein [Candidatus Poribacteria bacterium]